MSADYALPPETATLLQNELQPGERVAWIGQPIPGRFARRGILIAIFGIPFTAFALFWTVTAAFGTSHIGNPGGPAQLFRLFPLFGLPFVLAGLGLLSSPYWLHRKARRTAYVITDRRAVIFDPGFGRSSTIRSFEPDRLHDLRRVQNSDGTGDLVFERQWRTDGEGSRQSTDIGFLAIPNVQEVEGYVRTLAATASVQRAPS